jgi:hypothetical protein
MTVALKKLDWVHEQGVWPTECDTLCSDAFEGGS